MNQSHNTHESPESQLDRLVDGELSEGERRELLLTLDDQPEGWRRCALAFLEAQEWRKTLPLFQNAASEKATAELALKSNFGFGGKWMTWLAMAASFLIALGLGLWLRSPRGNGGGTPAPIADAKIQGASESIVNRAMIEPETVRLAVSGGNGESIVDLPVVNSADQLEALLDERGPVLPEQVRHALERLGHQVHQERQWVPVNMEDGRQMLVPVDQVQVRYGGRRPVQ